MDQAQVKLEVAVKLVVEVVLLVAVAVVVVVEVWVQYVFGQVDGGGREVGGFVR